MKYEAIGDYATAARFLQLPPGENLAELTKEFRVLYPNFQGSINLLSDDPNGISGSGASAWPGTCWCRDGGWHDRRRDPGAGGRSCGRKNMADFARDAGEYPEALRPAGERKANGSQSNQACPTKRTRNARDVIYAMALLAALDPARVVTSLAVDFSAERAQASLVQAAQTSLSRQSGIHHLACRSGA